MLVRAPVWKGVSVFDIVFSTCLDINAAVLALDCHIPAISLVDAAMTTYNGEFEDNVRDLLSNLYDYLKLVENPVARQLAGGQSGKERMGAIRRAALAAIEDLRREDAKGRMSRRNRLYHLLTLRYIEEHGAGEVLRRLALSERQYYREHQRALQTISRVIWDKHFADAGQGKALSLADELDYLSADRAPSSFDARAEIQAALRPTQVIAEQREIDIRVAEAAAPVQLHAAQPVFRQLVIYLLNDMIQTLPPGGRIDLYAAAAEGEPTVAFSSSEAAQDAWARLRQDKTAQALTKSLNARLQCDATRLTLRFERKVHQVLIVDDNPDTVSLFKRYLAKLPYQLLAARDEAGGACASRRVHAALMRHFGCDAAGDGRLADLAAFQESSFDGGDSSADLLGARDGGVGAFAGR